jgi:iron complex outermembrane receptor protein
MMPLTTNNPRGTIRASLLYSLVCLGFGCLAHAPSVRAQSTAPAATAASGEGAQLAEITVTAQKRAERAQDVPISDSTVSAAEAQSRGITDTTSLQMAVPGLVIDHTANEGNIFIRGVGTNLFGPSSEQTVATYVDNVYMPSPETNLFSFNNIDRVEVLKGPQGTLFGRNTTGGVVQIITKDPSTTFGGDVSVGYANYDTVTSQGYVTGGLLPDLAADIAVMYENQGIGWGHNFTTDRENGIEAKNNYALRSKWKFTPSDATTHSADPRLFAPIQQLRLSSRSRSAQCGRSCGDIPGPV